MFNRSPQHPNHSHGEDREQIKRARQAAEALFAPKRQLAEQTILTAMPSVDEPVRQPRMLEAVPKAPVHHEEPAASISSKEPMTHKEPAVSISSKEQMTRKEAAVSISSKEQMTRKEPAVSISSKEPMTPEIPNSQFARIRVWVKYGMKVSQVAEMYGVAVGEIERILRA